MGARRETTREDIEELIPAAMQVIGDGIEWDTFCNALNVTDDEARWLLHEMGHRLLAGFAGGWVSPSIYVVWSRRMAQPPSQKAKVVQSLQSVRGIGYRLQRKRMQRLRSRRTSGQYRPSEA